MTFDLFSRSVQIAVAVAQAGAQQDKQHEQL